MSRHGYSDDFGDDDPLAMGRYRQAVASAIRGKRGQIFFRELIAALDELPEKVLIAGSLQRDGCFCAFGAIGYNSGIDMTKMVMEDEYEDRPELPDDAEIVGPSDLAAMFNVAESLAREVMYENDEGGRRDETPEQRWSRVRRWAERQIIEWEPQ